MSELRAIAQFIFENYRSALKIVEIGVGHAPGVAIELKRLFPRCSVVVTDVQKPVGLPESLTFVLDNITNPEMSLYREAALLYSIHPPPELQPYMLEVARKVGADLLIKPLAAESMPLTGGKLVNHQGITFYIFKQKRIHELY